MARWICESSTHDSSMLSMTQNEQASKTAWSQPSAQGMSTHGFSKSARFRDGRVIVCGAPRHTA